MYRKFSIFILLSALLTTVSFAQETPKAKKAGKAKADSLYRISFGGSGGYLGIRMKEVSGSNYQELGLSEVRGVAIRKVLEDSAAEKAGLQDGDVIVSFNGEAVTSTRKFSRMIREVAPDHTVNLTVVRGGSEMQVPVTMGKRKGIAFVSSGDFDFPSASVGTGNFTFEMPDMPDMPSTMIAPDISVFRDGKGLEKLKRLEGFTVFSGRTIGIGVTSMTKQLGDYFGVESGKGLLINDVSKDSPAERAGLRAGDVIVEIDGKEVKNSFDLLRSVGDKKEGDVQLTIIRDRARQTISVTPEKRSGDFPHYRFKTKSKSKGTN